MADCAGRAFPLRGPLPFSGANASRHHLPRSIADKYLHFNHYDPSHNLLWHGDPAHRCLSGIPAWRRGLLDGLRHDEPPHRYSSAISAWRDGNLPVLRHGHHAHRHLSPIPAWRSIIQPVPDRSLSDALAGPSARRPSSKASQGLVLCNEYRSGEFRVREG